MNAPRRASVALVAVALALYAWVFVPVWSGWLEDWWNDPNYGHGLLLAPLLLLLIAWRTKERAIGFEATAPRGEFALALGLGFGLASMGTLAAESATLRLGSVLLLFALVCLALPPRLAAAWRGPVLAFLALVPWPYVVYYSATARLQRLSSAAAEASLRAVGVPLARDGNLLRLQGYQLEVVESCSGLRSLLTLFALAAVVAVFFRCSPRRTLVLLAASVPLALATNLLRLFLTGVAAQLAGPETAEGVFHLGGGVATFVVGSAALALLARPRVRGGTR